MTIQKNSPELVAASIEANHEKYFRTHYNALTPRLKRLLIALLNNPQGLPREAADRATPASNSPEYVSQLRNRLCLAIPCEMVPFVTVDGDNSKRGVYSLTAADRAKLEELLA